MPGLYFSCDFEAADRKSQFVKVNGDAKNYNMALK
jgi:hypothetical protein